jgi:multimeric flavodoxin WrbA
MATWVIICGSPYKEGICAKTARKIARFLEHENPQADVRFYSVGHEGPHGCIECETCKQTTVCIYQDEMLEIQHALNRADAALVISPIFFAGVPSQLKALLDRLQPYYWKRQKLLEQGKPLPPKKPLGIALVGEGGDPYGSDCAAANIASPFALANYRARFTETFIMPEEEQLFNKLSQLTLDLLSKEN